MSDTDRGPRRPRTRQAVKELEATAYDRRRKRSTGNHTTPHPDHIKKCFICYSEAERQAGIKRRKQRIFSTSGTISLVSEKRWHRSSSSEHNPNTSRQLRIRTYPEKGDTGRKERVGEQSQLEVKYEPLNNGKAAPLKRAHLNKPERWDELNTEQRKQGLGLRKARIRKSGSGLSAELLNQHVGRVHKNSQIFENIRKTASSCLELTTSLTTTTTTTKRTTASIRTVEKTLRATNTTSGSDKLIARASEQQNVALASSTKQPQQQPPQQQPSLRPPAPVAPPPAVTPPKPLNNIPLPPSGSTTSCSKPPPMATPMSAPSTGPLTRLQAQSLGSALEGQHHQVSATSVDEATLDQCFQIAPKWHYIKSNHDETAQWLESANFEAILLELLYFAHDQGHGGQQHKEAESQFERELERVMSGIERLDSLDAFCKTFIRDNHFRPVGRVSAAGSGKEEKYGRLFRMINTDLQSLQRQHRILSMVCSGTADHDVHTLAQRENLRKLVEDLVAIVHPNDRATYSEVYKVIAENASYDKRNIKPQISSLKLVSLPDIVVPFGGPLMAGGSVIKCDALEQKIRAKLPSLLIKMHFSDKIEDQKWADLSHVDDSGIAEDTGTGSPRSRSRERADEKGGSKASASGKSSGKRKHDDSSAAASRPKRHREELRARDAQPPDAHVINEIYGEHVAELICSLTSAPLGYVKHAKSVVSPADERDGTASLTVLGLIVAGEDVYLTKLDASHDYLESLVETFRADQLSFSCLANPLNLYKGTHLKALLYFLRHVCLNFPRTTYFLSD